MANRLSFLLRGTSLSLLLAVRLHRAGLIEDTSRCVMDIVEGRAAAPNAGSNQAAHEGVAVAVAPTPAAATVTLEVRPE